MKGWKVLEQYCDVKVVIRSKLSIRTTGENVPVILLYVKLKIKTFFYKKEL